jgi:hypothetical protein
VKVNKSLSTAKAGSAFMNKQKNHYPTTKLVRRRASCATVRVARVSCDFLQRNVKKDEGKDTRLAAAVQGLAGWVR